MNPREAAVYLPLNALDAYAIRDALTMAILVWRGDLPLEDLRETYVERDPDALERLCRSAALLDQLVELATADTRELVRAIGSRRKPARPQG